MKPRYKWLEVKNRFTGEVIEDASYEDDIPAGWYKAFGTQMLDELNDLLIKYNFEDEYSIIEIKEKFGRLIWYDNARVDGMYEEYIEWLNKYDNLSGKTCIFCGKPATHRTKGYILPVCDDCHNRNR